MGLAEDEKDLLGRLKNRIDVDRRGSRDVVGFDGLDRYYEGRQLLEQLGLAIPEELRRFVTIVAWPSVVVDAIEERLDVEGFRLPGKDDADEEIWENWQFNDLDTESQMGNLDAKIYGRAYTCVGTNEDDPAHPLVSVESPLEVAHSRNPRTRQVDAAARFYRDEESLVRVAEEHATLYLPDVTIWLDRDSSGWVETDRDEHLLGEVPVTPILNRGRLKKRYGTTEMLRALNLTDAAARALTNAQVATELLAVPQRYVLGATKGDFVDQETGKQLTAWEAYFGAVWALTNPEAKAGQFTAADLRNFDTIVNLYAQQLAGLYGLPMRYLGQNTANPPSADGIRADESRLVKHAERDQRSFGTSWERTVRLWRRFQDGGAKSDPRMSSLETLWRNAATPTEAETTDAVIKKVQTGILPIEAAWEDLGYSATRRMKLRAMREAELSDPVTQALLAGQRATQQPQPATPTPAPAAQGAFLG